MLDSASLLGPVLDASHLDLDTLADRDESALAQALRKVQRESRERGDGVTVHHSSSHSSSHGSSVW